MYEPTSQHEVWDLIRKGHNVAIVGPHELDAPTRWRPIVIRARCGESPDPLAPLLEAQRRMVRRLDEGWGSDPHGPLEELRHRLLGLPRGRAPRDGFLETANQLARWAPDGVVLVFERADLADPATVAYLARVLLSGRVGRPLGHGDAELLVPVVLLFPSHRVPKDAARLLEAVRISGGAVLTVEEPVVEPAEDPLRHLHPEVLRILRAGARRGREFSVPEVARDVGLDVVEVLEALQMAVDAGIPLEDDGDMNIRLPRRIAAHLERTTLPSLTQLKAPVGVVDRRPDVPPDDLLAAPPRPRAVPTPAPSRPATTPPPQSVSTSSPPASAATPATPPSSRSRRQPAPQGAEIEPGRAMDLAEKASRMGAYNEALAILEHALDRLAALPPDDAVRRTRIELQLAAARVQWRGADPEGGFSLDDAEVVAREARASLLPEDPAELRAHASIMLARLAYDRGDKDSLDVALDELTNASHLLMDAGQPYEAARLLNDQAAVYVRMGDPVRANHLLEQSRTVFAEKADTDPVAFREMAETDHLLARIPLHAPIRPGKETEAVELAMSHARRAEGAFKRLRDQRQLARVWETMGRLEAVAGHSDTALERLDAAWEAQEADADALGLARTAAAMADVYQAQGQPGDALALLAESIRLNRYKGSPLGLAFNRRSLARLKESAPPTAGLRRAERQVDELLRAAERDLGRVGLPGETDQQALG